MLANCYVTTPQPIFQHERGAPRSFPSVSLLRPAPFCGNLCGVQKFSGNQFRRELPIQGSRAHRVHLLPASAASNVNRPSIREDEIKASEPLRPFPVARFMKRVQECIVDTLVWAGKWLLVVIAVKYTLSEVVYAVVHGQELLIPLGMLAGTAFARIAGETFVQLFGTSKHGELPSYLLMLFFALLKLMGPALPRWGFVLLPQFANGGLWQTYLWRKHCKAESSE